MEDCINIFINKFEIDWRCYSTGFGDRKEADDEFGDSWQH